MAGPPRRLLITGFGPFPGIVKNPSAAAALAAARSPRWRLHGIEAVGAVLPTTYAALDTEWRDLLGQGFGAVLMVGVAGRSRALRVETRAQNRASLIHRDGARQKPVGPVLVPAAEAARRTKACAPAALKLLRARGLPARLSGDAGRYLCNAAYFNALDAIDGPVIFVHIPKGPGGRRGQGRGVGLTWNDRLAAGLVDLGLALARASPLRSPDR